MAIIGSRTEYDSDLPLEKLFIARLQQNNHAPLPVRQQIFSDFATIFSEHTSPIQDPASVFAILNDYLNIEQNTDNEFLAEITNYTASLVKKTASQLKILYSRNDHKRHVQSILSQLCKNLEVNSIPALRATIQCMGNVIRHTDDKTTVMESLISVGFLSRNITIRNQLIRYFRTYLEHRYLPPDEECFQKIISTLGLLLSYPESRIMASKVLKKIQEYVGNEMFVDHLNYCESDIQKSLIRELELEGIIEIEDDETVVDENEINNNKIDIESVGSALSSARSSFSNHSITDSQHSKKSNNSRVNSVTSPDSTRSNSRPSSRNSKVSKTSQESLESKDSTTNTAIMKFGLTHRQVFYGIVHSDQRVQIRSLSQLLQTLSDVAKQQTINKLDSKQLKELTDFLQFPIANNANNESNQLAINSLAIVIENSNPIEMAKDDSAITNSIISALFNLIRQTQSGSINTCLEQNSGIFRLIALLSEKEADNTNRIVERALTHLGTFVAQGESTKISNRGYETILNFLAVCGSACLVGDALSKENKDKLVESCEHFLNYENENIWMHACEILIITEHQLENSNSVSMRQMQRFDIRDQLAKSTNPPILDHNYTPKIPKERILELLTKRGSKYGKSANNESSLSYTSSGIESLSGSASQVSDNSDHRPPNFQAHTPTKRFHSAGKSRNKLPWAKTSSTTNKITGTDSLVSGASSQSLLPDKLEIQAKGITGPIKSSEPHSSIKTSPIPNKPSLVRTSSARNQSNARNAPQQTTVTSIYQSQHQSQTDFDSDTYSSRSSLISRESSASTIIPDLNDIINAPPNQTNSFHSFNSTAPVYQNPPPQQSYSPNALARHTHPVTSIGTPTTSQTFQISPIKGLSSNSNSPHVPGSPSLSKNIQKKLLEQGNISGATSPTGEGKPPIPTGRIRKKHFSERTIRSIPNLDELLGNGQQSNGHTGSSGQMGPNGQMGSNGQIRSNGQMGSNVQIGSNASDRPLNNNKIDVFASPEHAQTGSIGANSNPNDFSAADFKLEAESQSHDPKSLISLSSSMRARADQKTKTFLSRKTKSAGVRGDRFKTDSNKYERSMNNSPNGVLPNSGIPNNESSQISQISDTGVSPSLVSTSTFNGNSNSNSGLIKTTSAHSKQPKKSSANLRNRALSSRSRTSSGQKLPTASKYVPDAPWEPLSNPEESLKLALAYLSNSIETSKEAEQAALAGFSNPVVRADTDENNWKKTATGLQEVARLVRFHTQLVQPHLATQISPMVICLVSSLRSAVSKHALEAAEELCTYCCSNFTEKQYELLVKNLLGLIGQANNFLKENVDHVISAAAKNSSPNRLLNIIIAQSKASKINSVKEFCAKTVHDIVNSYGQKRSMDDYGDKLVKILAFYLTSNADGIRYWGKRIVTTLMTNPMFEEMVTRTSDSNSINTVLNQTEALRQNPLDSRGRSELRPKHSAGSRVGRSFKDDIGTSTAPASIGGASVGGYSIQSRESSSSLSRSLNVNNARGLHQISADNASIKELTDSMKGGSLMDRRNAIDRVCDRCLSNNKDDKRFITDNMGKIADAYLDVIKTSNSKVNECALTGLTKILSPNSHFVNSPKFKDHVPNFVAAIVPKLQKETRNSAERALDMMIDQLDHMHIFSTLTNRLQFERPLLVKKVLTDKIIQIIQGERGRGVLKNVIIERHALPALYSLAGMPQLRGEANILAETIQATLGAERIWQLADVNNKSQILAKFIAR